VLVHPKYLIISSFILPRSTSKDIRLMKPERFLSFHRHPIPPSYHKSSLIQVFQRDMIRS